MSELKKALKNKSINYSVNLNKLANSRKLHNHYKVYRIGWQNCYGMVNVEVGSLYFGSVDSNGLFSGGSVMSGACNRFKPTCTGSWGGMSLSEVGFIDVTDWFISEYKEKGMCAYSEHNHSFIERGDTRVCKFCRKTEKKHSKQVTKTWWS